MQAKRIILLLGAALLLLSLPLLGACGGDEGEPDVTAGILPLKIGLVAPLTGPAAAWGLPTQRTWELVFEQVNSAGGITVGGQKYELVLIAYDDKYDPAVAVTAAERLISQDKVKFMHVMISGATLAVQPLSEENEIVMFTSSTAPEILGPDYFFTFRGSPGHIEMVGAQLQWLMDEHPEVEKIAIIARDNASGLASMATYRLRAEELGLEIVFDDTYTGGTTDFYPILTEILKAEPDLIAPCGAGLAQLIKQGRELGYEGYYQTYQPTDIPVLVESAGVEACEGVFYGGAAGEPEALAAWEAAYTEKYGQFNSISLMIEPIPRVLIDSIVQAGTLDTRVGEVINGEGVVVDQISVDSMLRGMGEL